MLKETIFYFAYGSNVNLNRLNERIGRVQSFESFILNNFKLTFDAGLKTGKTSFANIIPCKDDYVEGILYEITPRQAAILDRFELLYERQYFIVDNKICFTYISEFKSHSRPTFHYLDIIETGAKDFNLQKLVNICREEKENCIYLIPSINPAKKSRKRKRK